MSTSSPQRGARLVEALLAAGVRHVVAAPGSRSAPLLLAAADAERQGLLRLHVRIDERSAGYLALGLARVSGTAVAVITTSGTAAVNLHPAIVEAAYLGVPLIAVTADRPAALRGSGANQTIDQRALFGIDASTIDLDGTSEDEFDPVIGAVTSAMAQHGPVHLNVSFGEPLVAEGAHVVRPVTTWASPPASARARRPLVEMAGDADLRRGLLIVGDGLDDDLRGQARELAETMGWPVISEPSGNLTETPQSLVHGPLLLGDPTVLTEMRPDVVVSVGRIGLHRSIMRLVREVPVHIAVDVAPRRGRVDPARTASVIVDAVPIGVTEASDPQWMNDWRRLDRARSDRVAAVLSQAPLTGPVVARILASHVDARDLLIVGASWPIRHLSEFGGPIRAHCLANRGTSGIDGVVSMAWGAAVAHRAGGGARTYALLGDLTAVYDRNGLLAPVSEPRPTLTYVVVDNDGGGIFSSLEQGAPAFAQDFERVFGTPLSADLSVLLAAPDVEVRTVSTETELREALGPHDGVRIVVARCVDRATENVIADRARG